MSRILGRTKLEELVVAKNRIGNEGVETLAISLSNGYKGFCELKVLDLSNNKLDARGLSRLFSGIRNNSRL